MTLNASEIALMRSTVSEAMPDACTITRETAQGAFNPTTGVHAAPTLATIYTGACRVRPERTDDRTVIIGDNAEILTRYVATVPFDADAIDVNDVLTVTASPYDADLVGVAFRIVDVRLGSWTLGRRLTLQKRD